MERFLRSISHFIFKYHKSIVALFSLLTVISIITILNMEIKTDIIDVLPRDNRTVNQFKDFLQKFGAMDSLIIAVQSGNKTIDDQIELIEDIVKRLNESPLIEYVDYSPLPRTNAESPDCECQQNSRRAHPQCHACKGVVRDLLFRTDYFLKNFPIFIDEKGLKQVYERLTPRGIERQISLNRQKLISPFSSPVDYEFIAKDPLNIREIFMEGSKKSDRNASLDLSSGYYFTKDHSLALIFVKPRGKSRDMAFVKQLNKELQAIFSSSMKKADNPAGVHVGFTGSYAISEEVRGVIKHDIISSFVLSVILISFLIWIAYRVKGVVLLIIGFTLLSSLSMTLAFAYLMFGSLNIVTSIVAAVLIGLYVDYSMHIVKRYGDELRLKQDPLIALEAIISKTGPAIVISAITTSLSFFTILVTKFEGLYELGIVSGIGVMLCLLSSLFLMSSLLVWVTKDGSSQSITTKKEVSSGVENLTKLIVTKPWHIILFSAVLIGVAGIGITKLGFDNNTEHIGIKDSRAIALSKGINKKIGKKGEPLNIVIKSSNKEELAYEFDSLERTLSAWKREGIIGGYDSLGTFLPPPSVQRLTIENLREMNRDNVLQLHDIEKRIEIAYEKNNLAYERDYIHTYLEGIINALSNYEGIGLDRIGAVSDPKINHFYNKADSSIASYIYPKGNIWDKNTIERIHAYVKSSGSDWILIGKPILFDEIKSSIISYSILASILGFLLNLVIVYWYFKNWFYLLMCMLPVVFGILLTLGTMGYINAPFNFINVGTIALIFGFGVDYGIYLMQAYLKEDITDIRNALQITGKNIMMCAATTIAGCGSLISAKFSGIASIGLVLSIGAISCASIALVVLPAILYLKEKEEKI
ncbi:MAG: MMPL family transporter [Nitrospirota bacterium]